DAKTVETAEEAYSANHGFYTANQQDLVDEGLMHSASTKLAVHLWTAPLAAAAAVPGVAKTSEAIPARPAIVADTYYLAGKINTDCDTMTFV
ncbi:MAG: hypothetical protein QOE00_1963, partial [Ilumatobacteraceae bacterium]